MRCWSNGRSYKVEVNDLKDTGDNYITNVAYILFTVKVSPGSVEEYTADEIEGQLHYNIAIRSTDVSDIGIATYIPTT